ncbi:MAG TPA: YdeI/OmpD-associated family protein [Pyrinomonadaceae bacterium]|jgi:hypothetical protein|nr:YdeI/OmpD-associated family protein [Pyrinomonadaceae bacterium]
MATTKQATKDAASKSPLKRFHVLLEQHESSTATGITIPFDVEKTFGARARVPVRGTINGFYYRSSIFPMGGCFTMVVNREMRAGAGVKAGERITVVMERDTEPRTVAPPADLARALKSNREAQAAWDKLSYTHKKEHARAVEEAKRPETRRRRIEKTLAQLAAAKKELRG